MKTNENLTILFRKGMFDNSADISRESIKRIIGCARKIGTMITGHEEETLFLIGDGKLEEETMEILKKEIQIPKQNIVMSEECSMGFISENKFDRHLYNLIISKHVEYSIVGVVSSLAHLRPLSHHFIKQTDGNSGKYKLEYFSPNTQAVVIRDAWINKEMGKKRQLISIEEINC